MAHETARALRSPHLGMFFLHSSSSSLSPCKSAGTRNPLPEQEVLKRVYGHSTKSKPKDHIDWDYETDGKYVSATCFLHPTQSRRNRRSRCFRAQGWHGLGAEVPDIESKTHLQIQSPDAATGHFFSYKVREGDTLTSIAVKFRTTVQLIALSNEIADIDYVPAGQLLLIPSKRSSEIITDGLNSVKSPGSKSKSVIVQTESFLSVLPILASPISFQTWHVQLALSVGLLLAIFNIVKRCISDHNSRRHQSDMRRQVEKDIQDAYHRPKLRRWQGILDDDRRVEEGDGDLLLDGRTVLDLEDEKLRQTYAQLESVYLKFLVDSGLSKSGYWRGGVPPAVEEN